MTGGWPSPVGQTPGPAYSLWAFHEKVRRWTTIRTGMTAAVAASELIERQDRIRRRGEPCRLVVLEDGREPS